jgi:predicted transcriptional regulator
MTDEINTDLINLTADIVSAHLSNNKVATGDVPGLIASIHAALVQTSAPAAVDAPAQEPAVPIRSSVKHDYIVCLEDGKKLKMLKRYLRTNYDMTPEEYRTKWKLPRDYPMVAPDYAATRKALAEKIGLGRKKAVETVEAAKAPAKRAATSISEGLDKARQHLGSDAANGDAATKPAAKRGRPAKAKAEAPATTDA